MFQNQEPTIQDIILNDQILHDKKEEALQKPLIDLSPTHAEFVNFFEDIEIGSQIACQTKIRVLDSFVWHHGIFIGNKQVIHMSGATKENATIQCVSVNKFMENAQSRCVVIHYDNDNEELRLLTCYFAHFFLEAHGSKERLYNIYSFNCEHFATFCRTGKWRYVTNTFIDSICTQTLNNVKPYFLAQSKWKKFKNWS